MSNLFTIQDKVTKDQCDAFAQRITHSSVTPGPWQGFHCYSVESAGIIVEFRSEESPLDSPALALAKAVHPKVVPRTTYHGFMPNSSVSVWLMESLPGTRYLFTIPNLSTLNQDVTVTDLALFFAESWRNPQLPDMSKMYLYIEQLEVLVHALPARFTRMIKHLQARVPQLMQEVPWVLTHQDISNTSIVVDDEGHITGIVDWVGATIEPFGLALCGLENVLGQKEPEGWKYFEHIAHLPMLFRRVFLAEIGVHISPRTHKAIDELRTIGVLLRYGFHWENGMEIPVEDTCLLDVFLGSEPVEVGCWFSNK